MTEHHAPRAHELRRRLQTAGHLPSPPAAEKDVPLVDGLRQAADGEWYLPDPNRKGKYLRVETKK